MEQRFQITVLSGVSAGDVFSFTVQPGEAVVIGRDQGCDLCLQDPLVSRKHAEIRLMGERVFLRDLESSHGTIYMGFALRPGEEGKQPLNNKDEFKIGGTTFRFQGEEREQKGVEGDTGSRALGVRLQGQLTPLRVVIGVLAVTAGLALLFLGGEGEKLAPQLSHVPLNMPYERVAGYLPGPPGAGSDTQHMDKVQVALPPVDLLIEFDYISQAPLEIFINETLVQKLPPYPAGWEQHVVLYRDAARGSERRLIIDNVTYPPREGGSKEVKRWGVRNIRATPIVRGSEPLLESSLTGGIALLDQLNKTPDSYLLFLRSLQRAILLGLEEANLDAVGYRVILESILPSVETVRQRLESVRAERSRGVTAQAQNQHLQELLALAGGVDAELWRRTHLALKKAREASERKDHIEAHDLLIALREVIPEESDLRRAMAEKLYNDNKFIPAKVRNSPEKFRRAKKP